MDQHTPVPVRAGVIVGTDGSATALRAVAWAATEARLRGTGLSIVHAAPYADTAPARRHAEGILGRARTVARRHEPGISVTTRTLDAEAATAVPHAAADADLLVVGMVGERASDVLTSSVATTVAMNASGTVAVVRGQRQSHASNRPVLLAVTDPDADRAAVDAAFADADRHGSGVLVVQAAHDSAAEDRLDARLQHWRDRYPDIRVEVRTERGSVLEVLLGAAGGARLVVTGSHGRGALARAVLGSTSRGIIRLSPCPVLVVPRSAAVAASPAVTGADRTS
jgi:nucleotide-binding universal stress UspA family protein